MPKLIQNNEFISGSPIMDATPQPNSTHAVQSGGVYTAFNNLSTEVSAINSKLGQMFPDNRTQIKCTDITVMSATEIASGAVISQQFNVPSDVYRTLSITLFTDAQNYFTTGVSLLNNKWWFTIKNEYSQKLTTSLKARIVYTI